ncbi:MAG: hypothetical protein D6720_02755 [Gammaproteobacteria bacterium]|nr:MAG: hypothetical protein D6720_02755 [Gammaproteobacteria bacterium]
MQGSRIARPLEIHSSRKAAGWLALLALVVPVALRLASWTGWWVVAVAWVFSLWWVWRGTVGLGAGRFGLRYRPGIGWEGVCNGERPTAITAVRPIVVGPRLVIAALKGEGRHYSLVVADDAGTPGDLRRLRQLLLCGLPRSAAPEGAGQPRGDGT